MPKEEKPIRQNIAEEVTVKKEELLKAVKINRDNHRKEFELAVDGWHDMVVAILDQWRADIIKGKKADVSVSLPMPQDHTKDYDRTIRMLEMHVDELVTIPTVEFAQFVMDQWNWKQQWSTANANYVATAATKFGSGKA